MFELVVTNLHSATPSFSPSNKSASGSLSPSTSSIQFLTSFAAAVVYLARRMLRRSLSRDETDAMEAIIEIFCIQLRIGIGKILGVVFAMRKSALMNRRKSRNVAG